MERRGAAQPSRPRLASFLLAQLGSDAATKFAERLQELDRVPPHAGILRSVATNPGISQQALASMLGMVPSRLVTWLDDLEARGFVERRDDPDDRRLYALHLTAEGVSTLSADRPSFARPRRSDARRPEPAGTRAARVAAGPRGRRAGAHARCPPGVRAIGESKNALAPKKHQRSKGSRPKRSPS